MLKLISNVNNFNFFVTKVSILRKNHCRNLSHISLLMILTEFTVCFKRKKWSVVRLM